MKPNNIKSIYIMLCIDKKKTFIVKVSYKFEHQSLRKLSNVKLQRLCKKINDIPERHMILAMAWPSARSVGTQREHPQIEPAPPSSGSTHRTRQSAKIERQQTKTTPITYHTFDEAVYLINIFSYPNLLSIIK